MSLNHLVQANTKYIYNQDLRANDIKLNTITFNDPLLSNGKLKTEVNSNGNQNELLYRNENGIYQPLSNSYQRVYQQLSPYFTIPSNNQLHSLYDATNGIGSTTIKGNTLRKGSIIKMTGNGFIETQSSNQNFDLVFAKAGYVLGVLSGQLPNISQTDYEYNVEATVYATGEPNTAIVRSHGTFSIADSQGNTGLYFIDYENTATFRTDIDENLDVKFKFVNIGNTLEAHESKIEILF